MDVSGVWEYLTNVWVLVGLVLVLFSSILMLLPVKILDSSAVFWLMRRGMNYLFILGLVSITLGFVQNNSNNQSDQERTSAKVESAKTVQKIENGSGTAINSGGNVVFNQAYPMLQDCPTTEQAGFIDQQIKGNSGIAVNAGCNVSMDTPEKE